MLVENRLKIHILDIFHLEVMFKIIVESVT